MEIIPGYKVTAKYSTNVKTYKLKKYTSLDIYFCKDFGEIIGSLKFFRFVHDWHC